MKKIHTQVVVNKGEVPLFDKNMNPTKLPVLEIQFHKDSEVVREIISESTGYRLYRELKNALNLN
jgi:hypothetical protein